MKMLDLIQGTPEWLAHRDQHYNASDAPAMMGCSPYKTRAQLLREKKTGIAVAVDASTQRRFDDGHRFEELARPLAEEIIGEQLFPVTGSKGMFSASFDGLTLMQDVAFEHKTLSAALSDVLHADCKGFELPLHYRVQMEHQCMVSGAQRVLFMASRWNDDDTLADARHCWYHADEDMRRKIVDGWAQFERDLAVYELPAPAAEPARAEHMESLPAVSVRLDGALSVVGNLPSFAVALREFVGKIPQRPVTDTDFATTEAACKALKKAEEALDAAEAGALASITDVDAMRRAVADCRRLARDTRLAAEKMVERRKVEIKESAVMAARKALDEHVAQLNAELAPMRLLLVPADFAGAIKGLRSIASMQDALDTTLANAKIAADGQARGIRANVAVFKAAAEGLEFLFADLGSIIHKAGDDFATLVQSRIAAHRSAEAEREAQRKAAEEARIAAALKAKQEAAQRQAEADAARIAARAAAAAQDSNRNGVVVPRADTPHIEAGVAAMLAAMPQPTAAPVVQAPIQPAKPAEVPTLNLSAINERLGCCAVTGAHVADLGVIGIKAPKGPGLLFTESQFEQIVHGLMHKLQDLADRFGA